jgi:integrase
MANLRKRGPSQWQAQVRVCGYPNQTKTFDTRAAAERWAKATEVEMAQGAFLSRTNAQSTTLRELLDRYLTEVSPLKKGAEIEAVRIKAFQRHPLACRYVATIRGLDIARFRDERMKSVSSATVRRELIILSHVFEVARKEWDIYVLNPIRDVKLPHNGRARDRRLVTADAGSGSEETRLFIACENARNQYLSAMVRLAIETGMRQGELLALRWENIDLNRRTAFLPDTKNGDARTVPLSSIAIETLTLMHNPGQGRVFDGVTREAIKRAFMRATVRAGIHDFHFHDLRHEATTRFFERGLNVMEVASITGHKDLGMLRRYTHLKAEDLAKKLG